MIIMLMLMLGGGKDAIMGDKGGKEDFFGFCALVGSIVLGGPIV